ncbi:uncharacterized protein PFL1_01157 [Pseudozyma flocculosa PF-1]|uniref:uncharacterized protein n=1 Tax=Pseudozyma flocculosa PF-1 TaxID=1277687 RepID=UPI0004560492|nr:uncharacterized protein PFL1_01157 [Pseudozyma flocculosa PF-1]EPQ30968.1 hypothetical protein PFL1_01157 [Pseudozyma flocculosa PF-1]
MLADMRILTAPSSDTPLLPPVMLQFGADRYLFNAGEGTSRSCTQRKANLSRVTNIFVPRIGWEAIGGLPGVLMSQADGNRTASSVHGPANLCYALATMRTYAKRDTMQLHQQQELDEAPGQLAKRPRLDNEAQADEAAVEGVRSRWRRPSWNPAKLKGDEAQAWIRMVADSLFNDSLLEKRQRASDQGVEIADLDTEAQYSAPGWKPPRTPAFVISQLPDNPLDLIARNGSGDVASAPSGEQGGQAPVLAFICEAHPQRGKFDPAKALEAGVVPGPSFAALTRGDDVQVSRPKSWAQMDAQSRKRWSDKQRVAQYGGKRGGGARSAAKKNAATQGSKGAAETDSEPAEWADVESVTIRSQDVLGPSRAGAVFMQIYLPSAAYIPSLLSAESDGAFAAYAAGANVDKPAEQHRMPHAIVHAVPLEVLRDERYQQWMARFGPDCHHILCNDDVCANKLMFPSSSTIPLRLSKLDQQLFRVPQYQLAPRVSLDELRKGSPTLASLQLVAAEADQLVQLHPRGAPKRHRSGAPDFDFALGSDEAERMASFQLEAVDESEEQRAQTDKLKDKNRKAAGKGANGASPKDKAIESAELGLVRQERLQEARKKAWSDYLEAVETTRRQLQLEGGNAGGASVAPADDVLITTLGTGSASPSKYRNVISTLVQTPRDGNILLDAGEATYGLLKRKFGCDRDGTSAEVNSDKGEDVDAILRNLRCLFISHIHADHHIGLIRLLVERRKLHPRPAAPLHLVATSFVHTYLREYASIEDLGLDDDVVLLNNEFLDYRTGVDPLPDSSAASAKGQAVGKAVAGQARSRHVELSADAKAALNLSYLHTARVHHRGSHCYGLVVRHASGWSLTYSGDTRPSDELIAAGRGSTVLIHEATLEDSQLTMAIAKGHSTFGEAIDVGRRMDADNLLLTHFSQRYPKMARSSLFAASSSAAASAPAPANGDRVLQPATEHGTAKKMPIALAFDLVTYPLSKFGTIQKYTPALEALFAADFDEDANDVEMGEGGGDAAAEGQVAAAANGQGGTDTARQKPSATPTPTPMPMDVDDKNPPSSAPPPATAASGAPVTEATKTKRARARGDTAQRKSFHPTEFHYLSLRL